jgi:hypothetical protein
MPPITLELESAGTDTNHLNAHINALANGLGAQSMVAFLMMCRREIPATISLTSQTGWEFDRLWSNGRRTSNQVYFDEVVIPLAKKYGVEARIIKSVDKFGNELPGLRDYVRQVARSGNFKGLNIPMFGSKKGQITQRCTDKMKIRACRQELRRMGAKTARIAQGIHIDEAWRRVKGNYLGVENGWSIYQTVLDEMQRQPDGTRIKVRKIIKWLTHYYPLVDMKKRRTDCQQDIIKEGIPYLISSECDGCPWKDLARWRRTDPKVLAELAETEAMFNGEFFFTDRRIPLMEAIQSMEMDESKKPDSEKIEPDFGCGNAECGI